MGERGAQGGGPTRWVDCGHCRGGALSSLAEERRRVLGVDLGDVRIGVALSDPFGLTAQPVGNVSVRPDRSHFGELVALVRDHDVGCVVVGLPLLMSGAEGARAAAAREVAGQLQEALPGVEVVLWDERLTTVQAERALIEGNVRRRQRRSAVDALAAAILLQSFLDAR